MAVNNKLGYTELTVEKSWNWILGGEMNKYLAMR